MKTKLYISLCFATLSWFTPFPFLLLVTFNICHQMSDILDMTWFSDKTWFHLLGFVNRQMCIWSVENPCTIPTVSPSTENGVSRHDFFLWSLLKGECLNSNLALLATWKETFEIATIPHAMLAATFANMEHSFSRKKENNSDICNQVTYFYQGRYWPSFGFISNLLCDT